MAYFTGTNNDDTIFATNDDDVIGGGLGNDTIYSRGGNDEIWDTRGNNWISAGDGDDLVVTGSGNDTIYGGNGNDVLYGGLGNDHIHGGNGNDIISDRNGYDDISGGAGNDTIFFSGQAHRIYGGNYGQAGDGETDLFILDSWQDNVDLTNAGQAGDVIADFEVGIDILNLANLGIQASEVTINQYQNGWMVGIDTGTNQLDIGVRTGLTGALTLNDIIVA